MNAAQLFAHPIQSGQATGAGARLYKRLSALLMGLTLAVTLGLAPQAALAKSAEPARSEQKAAASVPNVALASLPQGARDTHALILNGGPFKYSKDATTFGNREKILPRQPRGYYREYTVRTPGSRDRGARRIVCGAQKTPTVPDNCYYTDDHYSSFKRIVP